MPATAATVSVAVARTPAVAEATRHSAVVPLVHDDVAQSTEASVAVGVASMEAKARPLSVAVRPPVEGTLSTPTFAQLRPGANFGGGGEGGGTIKNMTKEKKLRRRGEGRENTWNRELAQNCCVRQPTKNQLLRHPSPRIYSPSPQHPNVQFPPTPLFPSTRNPHETSPIAGAVSARRYPLTVHRDEMPEIKHRRM